MSNIADQQRQHNRPPDLYLARSAQDECFDDGEEQVRCSELVAYDLRGRSVARSLWHEGKVALRIPVKLICAAESEAGLEIEVPYSVGDGDI